VVDWIEFLLNACYLLALTGIRNHIWLKLLTVNVPLYAWINLSQPQNGRVHFLYWCLFQSLCYTHVLRNDESCELAVNHHHCLVIGHVSLRSQELMIVSDWLYWDLFDVDNLHHNSLQNVHFDFCKLIEWRRFVTYFCNDPCTFPCKTPVSSGTMVVFTLGELYFISNGSGFSHNLFLSLKLIAPAV